MLIDSHCHLDYSPLKEQRTAVVSRAREAGVRLMVNIATTAKDFPIVRSTAEEFEDVYCSAGVHPHNVADEGENLTTDDLIKLGNHAKVIAFGETGLDYYYDHAPRDTQAASFRNHLRACVALDLPVIVHSRDAEDDTATILREESQGGKLKGVMHCFSSRRPLAEAALDLGFYISLSGIITFRKSEELRAIAKDVPINRLLVETDSPYLSPEPHRGKPNEPAFVTNTARALANLLGISEDEIASRTTDNFFRLFTKAKPPKDLGTLRSGERS